MDHNRNDEKHMSEPPPEFSASPVHDRMANMNLGSPPNANGDDVSPIHGDSASQTGPPPPAADPNAKIVHEVVNSEIGVSTLLNRLKQSIASANDFASFLKKRSTLEEQHSSGLKKLCRVTAENNRRPEHRHGSYLQAYDQVTSIHERMADNGAQFAISLHQMSEDLTELALNIERGRKHWKATGLTSEQRVADTENLMRKSKAKYDSLAEDYDRARTGEKQASKKFGIKGPKSAAQHEEDLLRKLQAADADYAQKVQAAQSGKAELQSKLRPEAVRAMLDLIKECDSAVTLQMQKFASFNEKLLLSNGLNISPLKGADPTNQRSLREVVYGVDNEKDLSNYLASFGNKVPPKAPEIKYERNHVLNPQGGAPPPASAQRQSEPPSSFNSRQGPPPSFNQQPPQQQQHSPQQSQPPPFMTQAPPSHNHPPPTLGVHERSFSSGGPPPAQYNNSPTGPSHNQQGGAPRGSYGGVGSSGPPQLNALPFETSHSPPPPQQLSQQPQHQQYPPQQQYSNYSQPPPPANNQHLPPLKPVFGLSLEQLFDRDGHAVPPIVSQCIQAVDLFGLDQEGIYRLSGTASHIQKIKAMFDNDASQVDFRNPEAFFHDVNSVAGLLKQFFRDLPDPLLTTEHYAGFIDAAKHEDDTTRRDSLHAIINALPDPNYATLRAITLHLHRVVERSSLSRMNESNLAIIFGPTLMGTNTGPNIQDAGFQVTCIETILLNCYQIFDDD